jgi:hypothetical protein
MTEDRADFAPNPARGYSWPPFEPGNVKSLKHGADSPRVIREEAVAVHAHLLEVAPWLDRPEFLPSVARYLAAEVRWQILHTYISQIVTERGAGAVPSRTFEQVTAAARLAAQLGHELGLSPLGRAEVQAAVAKAEIAGATVADLAEQGKLIRQRRAALLAQDGSGVSDVPPTDLNATAANVSTPVADSEGTS